MHCDYNNIHSIIIELYLCGDRFSNYQIIQMSAKLCETDYYYILHFVQSEWLKILSNETQIKNFN